MSSSLENPSSYYAMTRKYDLHYRSLANDIEAEVVINKRQGKLLQALTKDFQSLNPDQEITDLEGSQVRSIVGSDIYSCALKRIFGKDRFRAVLCSLGKVSHRLNAYRVGHH
ncbi:MULTISPECIES: hypothetical protein [unclassified Pseudomonas]|uniref:hypothetical protein n=1 Tax=unclassified Pseudomonas TaxID=196821 RepID=UPI000885DD07|nr:MULTISPECIES: hypothetical protein [unclassified Pseudomonas]SCY74633.1 hypothetical protein SAMN03159391_02928 [Pseudomonas sp. NFACC37-1]SFN91877.1 hypothetical protein SAMN03159304_01351 [Pseudomonas sp. NFACC24-1]